MHIKMPVGHAMEKNLFVFLIALLPPLASPSVAGDTFRIEFLGASDAALDLSLIHISEPTRPY